MIHFGADDCSRVLVLQNSGYSVHQCSIIPELKSALDAPFRPAAALFSDSSRLTRFEAVSLVRDRAFPPPIIFFSHSFDSEDEQSWPDLLVPPFTSPERWLRWVASVIEQSRALRADSVALRERSALLRREAFAAGRRSILERVRSAQTIADMEDFMNCVTLRPRRSGLLN